MIKNVPRKDVPKRRKIKFPSYKRKKNVFLKNVKIVNEKNCNFLLLFLLIKIGFNLLTGIGKTVCILKSHRFICVTFSWKDSWLGIYYFSVRSKLVICTILSGSPFPHRGTSSYSSSLTVSVSCYFLLFLQCSFNKYCESFWKKAKLMFFRVGGIQIFFISINVNSAWFGIYLL